ncbi:hypothetical protein ACH47B_28580 [Rhodococcus sp. NPDC019627]
MRGGVAWRQLPTEVPSATAVYAIFARGPCGSVAADSRRVV